MLSIYLQYDFYYVKEKKNQAITIVCANKRLVCGKQAPI